MPQDGDGIYMRRSSRLSLRIPVIISGKSSEGDPFSEETYVVCVSKYGAKLATQHSLEPGMEITLQPKGRNQSAAFRVVWSAPADPQGAGEVGIECPEVPDFLGVTFPE